MVEQDPHTKPSCRHSLPRHAGDWLTPSDFLDQEINGDVRTWWPPGG
jgi:hypothetical protein